MAKCCVSQSLLRCVWPKVHVNLKLPAIKRKRIENCIPASVSLCLSVWQRKRGENEICCTGNDCIERAKTFTVWLKYRLRKTGSFKLFKYVRTAPLLYRVSYIIFPNKQRQAEETMYPMLRPYVCCTYQWIAIVLGKFAFDFFYRFIKNRFEK